MSGLQPPWIGLWWEPKKYRFKTDAERSDRLGVRGVAGKSSRFGAFLCGIMAIGTVFREAAALHLPGRGVITFVISIDQAKKASIDFWKNSNLKPIADHEPRGLRKSFRNC